MDFTAIGVVVVIVHTQRGILGLILMEISEAFLWSKEAGTCVVLLYNVLANAAFKTRWAVTLMIILEWAMYKEIYHCTLWASSQHSGFTFTLLFITKVQHGQRQTVV